MDSDRILELIDNVLPFEVCLFYRVIPLKVTADRVHFGMVDPEDQAALDYLNRLFQHVGRSVVANAISVDAHQFVMSSYLNLTNQRQSEEGYSPPSLDWLKSVESVTSASDSARKSSVAPEADPTTSPESASSSASDQPRSPAETPGSSNDAVDDIKLFEIQPEPPHLPVSMLVMLPPERLLPALLAQVLSSGIGRLFFERRETQGSILYSQDGVRQSVLDALPLDLFQATLDRLKQFMELDAVPDPPPTDAASAKTRDQRESDHEFIYREERVLLRLRVMPGNYGEEATLQVLRGKAMEFYQEKKLEEWSRAAMSSAKLLKFLVRKIRSAYLHRAAKSSRNLTFLPQLEHLLDQLENEMEEFSHSASGHDSTPAGAPSSATNPNTPNNSTATNPSSNSSSTLDSISRRLMR